MKAKKTRFGSHYIVMHRLIKVRVALVSMALSKQWENLKKFAYAKQHDIVHKTIMDDDFWRNATKLLKITKPIYTMIRFAYSDKAVIGEVYEQMDTTLGQIKDVLINDPILQELVQNLEIGRASCRERVFRAV